MNDKKLEIAKLATQLTTALLTSGKFNELTAEFRPAQPNKTPTVLQVFDTIFAHLSEKTDA